LDADSLMSAQTIEALSTELTNDPAAGLIQTAPVPLGGDTLFARMQQFATVTYGCIQGEGLAGWSGREGNYFGHNAIIRMEAFAASAGIPHMPSRTGAPKLIMSHDFIEAGLLRRAGWALRFMPGLGGSFEEPPASLIDYALRDRRWCHGNLQHLRLLGTRGFHAITRFHLLQGAMSYLMSPAWFALLVIWALLGNGPESIITYFSEENPLYPMWPEMSPVNSLLIMIFMYGMLLAPKVMGALSINASGIRLRQMGAGWFILSLLVEVMLAILYAPILMVQQLVAVLRTCVGITPNWVPAARKGGNYSLGTVFKFHAHETVSGLALTAGMVSGLISLFLLPIAVSLILAVPLSMLSGLRLRGAKWREHLMATNHQLNPPDILLRALLYRSELRAPAPKPMAAE